MSPPRGGRDARAPSRGPVLWARVILELRDISRIPRRPILDYHRCGRVLKDFSCQLVSGPHIGRGIQNAAGKAALSDDIGSVVTDDVMRDSHTQGILTRRTRTAREKRDAPVRIAFDHIMLHDCLGLITVGGGFPNAARDENARALKVIPHRIALNPDVQHIIIAGAWERIEAGSRRDPEDLVPLHRVPPNPRHHVIVGAVIPTGEHVDTFKAIVGYEVVLEVDVEGVVIRPISAPCNTDPHEGGVGDSVTSEGGVTDDVVIALGEQKDPVYAIPCDLVVGDRGVINLGVRPGSRQVDPDGDANTGVVLHQVMSDGGVGKAGVWDVAGCHEEPVDLRFSQDIVCHRRVRDGPWVGKIPSENA